ncbi:MAG: TonB-dependent receptor [Acidobacteriaceae bacterium]|nr:TonB-dependent receptor [Acidobacteriaceae bacterium]
MRLIKKSQILFAAALAALSLGALGSAQTFSASIAGVISDPSGGVVSNATVHLKNMSTNDVRDAKSETNGSYKFDNLLPGTYEIRVEAAGFKTYVQSNMILRASTGATVNIPLEVGATQQQVEVSGEAILIDTQTANNSVTLDSQLVQSLPNSYRNPLNFVFALAGTTEAQSGLTSRSTSFDQYGSAFGLNGGRSGNEQILIDGAPSTAVDWGGLLVAPVQDSVQEQQISQNQYDAQYERAGSGVVTLITRSGTNAFHGEAYDYLRNSALDANTWSNDQSGAPKNQLHRNQFGGNIGGPIWKKANLFFFAAYEGLRQPDTESSGFLTVPTAAERNGDFSQTLLADGTMDVIYNPFSTKLVTDAAGNTYYTRTPFAGNRIPSNLFDPVGQKILNLYPLPNRPSQGVNDLNNYFAQGKGLTANDKFDWRVDWDQSSTNRVFVRMSDRVRQDYTPACFFCNGADNSATNDDSGFQVVVNDTLTPSPTWVIDSYIDYGRWYEAQTSIGYGVADASAIGLSPTLFQAPLLPVVNANLYETLGSTYSSYNRYVRTSDTAMVNLTKEFTRHTLKFGANYDVALINNIQENPGSFNFSQANTSCDAGPAGGPCAAQLNSILSGNSIASMLMGVGNGSTSIEMDPAMSLHTYGAYVQDQWRVNQRLTVTAGLRYENQRPATERYNRLTYFNDSVVNPISSQLASPVMGAFQYAGQNGNGRYAWGPDNTNFAPRAGLAYKITERLVARAGAGIFFEPASAMVSFDQPGEFLGYSSTTNWIGTANSEGYIPSNLVSNPFPNGIVQPTGSAQGALTYVGNGASQIWPGGSHPIGYAEQWSFDLQYQLGSHSVVEAGYTGVRGRRLMYGNPNINADQLPTQDLALGNQLNNIVPNPFYGVITDPNSALSGQTITYNQLLRPYPEYTYLVWTRSLPGARSQFDALNLKYNHAFSNGLSLISTYQWSKALDNGSEDFLGWAIGNMWRDSYNTKLDYGISAHDVPQSFATAFVYQLPYGSGRHWGSNAPRAVNAILGGWELSGIVRLASGLPLLPVQYSSNPLSQYGFPGPGLPDVIGNPKPANQNPNNWINASAFTAPPAFTYGNEPQHMTQLREAPTKNLDLSIAKTFGPERFKAQLRGEFLNVFNHPIYGGEYYGGSSNIGVCLDCGNLGIVYGTRNDPRNIQLSLKLMF